MRSVWNGSANRRQPRLSDLFMNPIQPLHHLCPLTHCLRHSFYRPWYSFPFYLLDRFLLSHIRSALCCSAPSRALASSLDFNHKERTYSSMGFGLCIFLSAHLCHLLDLLFSLMYRFYISLNRTMISIRKSLSYHKLSFRFLTALMLSDQHSIKRMCENIFAAVYGTKHTTQ